MPAECKDKNEQNICKEQKRKLNSGIELLGQDSKSFLSCLSKMTPTKFQKPIQN